MKVEELFAKMSDEELEMELEKIQNERSSRTVERRKTTIKKKEANRVKKIPLADIMKLLEVMKEEGIEIPRPKK